MGKQQELEKKLEDIVDEYLGDDETSVGEIYCALELVRLKMAGFIYEQTHQKAAERLKKEKGES